MGPFGRLVALGTVAALALLAALSVSLLAPDNGAGKAGLPQPTELCDATGIEGCQPVKHFDAKSLYKDDAAIDQGHPNRIDFYGQLFQSFPAGTDTTLQKIFKLKKQLRKLAALQSKFAAKLNHPVHSTLQVLPGEPGRKGKRGPRGDPGPPGFMGATGPAGRPGFPGRPGLPGDAGNRGPDGRRGWSGKKGRAGVEGPRGPVGIRGPPGSAGKRGPLGPPGYAGEPGPQGTPGNRGNRGPRGTSPRGPPGNTGLAGAQGPAGPRGGVGKRGAAGVHGYPGQRGDTGAAGMRGQRGRDAKRIPKGQCGMADSLKKSICCGNSRVAWSDYHGTGAYLDVDTHKCKFSDNDVMYFTNIHGDGGQWTSVGAQAIYSSRSTGFRVYIAQTHGGTAHSWWMNALQQRIRWCGVGVSTGPKVEAMCCGVGRPSDLGATWGVEYTDVSTKACSFGGDPIYLNTLSGRTVNGRSTNWDLSGPGASYPSIGPAKKWFRVWIAGLLSPLRYFATPAQAQVYDWRLNWCGFGTAFPSGDMRILANQISADEYPCTGVRLVDGAMVASNRAEVCCGIEDHHWKAVGANIAKSVDAARCGFKSSKRVVWLTSLKGAHSHWKLGGISAPIDPTNAGFSIQLAPYQSSVSVSSAASLDYRLQWCGIGEV